MQEALASTASAQQGIQSGEIIIGKITDVDATGAWVQHPKNPTEKSLLAISTIAIAPPNIGREVALLFNGADLTKPVIMGLIHSPVYDVLDAEQEAEYQENQQVDQVNQSAPLEVISDGKKHIIEAEEEMILKCGKASIGLRKDGRIQIRGTSVTTRSSGKNRILGASISLN